MKTEQISNVELHYVMEYRTILIGIEKTEIMGEQLLSEGSGTIQSLQAQ